MIVGFTITDFKGQEKAAVEYIRKVCILESSEIAQNIVDVGPGVNIFSKAVVLSELMAQPFSATPIETQEGKYLLASLVNFNLELLYNSSILRLVPTGYIYVELNEISQFEDYLKQGLVGVIPEMNLDGQRWILSNGFWNDDGIWVDSNYWRDTK